MSSNADRAHRLICLVGALTLTFALLWLLAGALAVLHIPS